MEKLIMIAITVCLIYYSCERKPDSFQDLKDQDKILLLILRQSVSSFNLLPPPPMATGGDTTVGCDERHFEPIRHIYLHPQWLQLKKDEGLNAVQLPDLLSEYIELFDEIKEYAREEEIKLDGINKFFGDSIQVSTFERNDSVPKVKVAISSIAIDTSAGKKALACVSQTMSGLDGGTTLLFFEKNEAGVWEIVESIEVEVF